MNTILKTKPDPTLKDFYRDRERFADLINGICFNGERIVCSQYLESVSNEESSIYDSKGNIYSFPSYRDILFRLKDKQYILFIGLENQQNIDRLIGLREFLYTAFSYNLQYREYQRECRKRRKEGREVRKFKLLPVITPVVYFGEDTWKSNHWLSDIMDYIPEVWKSLVNDWYTRVIDVKDFDTALFQNKDNRDLFDGIRRVYNSKEDLSQLNDMKVSRETAILIASITGMNDLVNIIMEEESEEINMCRSWEIMKEKLYKEANEYAQKNVEKRLNEELQNGLNQGLQQGLQKGTSTTVLNLLNKKLGNLSLAIQYEITNSPMNQLDLLVENLFSIESEQDILNIIN